jgi:predicted NBD/HSP70 family sugar kinase
VILENDANAAALGENGWERGDVDDLIYYARHRHRGGIINQESSARFAEMAGETATSPSHPTATLAAAGTPVRRKVCLGFGHGHMGAC